MVTLPVLGYRHTYTPQNIISANILKIILQVGCKVIGIIIENWLQTGLKLKYVLSPTYHVLQSSWFTVWHSFYHSKLQSFVFLFWTKYTIIGFTPGFHLFISGCIKCHDQHCKATPYGQRNRIGSSRSVACRKCVSDFCDIKRIQVVKRKAHMLNPHHTCTLGATSSFKLWIWVAWIQISVSCEAPIVVVT